MTDEIRVVYEDMEAMSRAFAQGGETLEDVLQEMQSIANALEDGALLGDGGEAFTDAIRSRLAPAISRLIDKFRELDGDVQAAVAYARQADAKSTGMF